MAGGYGAGEHGTLAERVAATARREAPRRPDPVSPARHCLVDGEPSLLVEWTRTDRGWEGRVVSVSWLEGVGWAMVERWLPVARIEQAG